MKRWLAARAGLWTAVIMMAVAQYMDWIDASMAATLLAVFAWSDAADVKEKLWKLQESERKRKAARKMGVDL